MVHSILVEAVAPLESEEQAEAFLKKKKNLELDEQAEAFLNDLLPLVKPPMLGVMRGAASMGLQSS